MNTEELEVERVVDAARKWGGELNHDCFLRCGLTGFAPSSRLA